MIRKIIICLRLILNMILFQHDFIMILLSLYMIIIINLIIINTMIIQNY